MQPLLQVNLSTRSITKINVPEEWEVQYIGGASLGARILYKDLTHSLDPLSAEAPLLFINGPLSGTAGPAVGRFVVCAKSPATGLWGESNCGGFWGPELRMAGYDGLWIIGRSETPVYLVINDENIEFRSALHLWGMDTYSTQAALRNEINLKNPRIAVIGQAGEARIPFALIMNVQK